jgi:hypothetical protein
LKGIESMKKAYPLNAPDSSKAKLPLSKCELINLAINERKMVRVEWKYSFTKKIVPEFIFPLHIFEYLGQEYVVWERPTEANLDCAPIVAMGPVEMSSKYFMSNFRPEDIEQFQKQWIYFEDGKDIDPSSTVKRVILKVHAPLMMVDFTPLQEIWGQICHRRNC